MTKTTWAQGGTLDATPADPVDLLVPPPRSMTRSVGLAIVVAVVVIGVVTILNVGVVRPRLGLDLSSSSFTQAGPTSRPGMTFIVRNNGRLPLTIDGLDARGPGLGAPIVTFASDEATGSVGRPLDGSINLSAGKEVRVTMAFASWNCRGTSLGASPTVRFHVRDPFGLHVTESLVPGHQFSTFGTGLRERAIGWSAAITWTSCHPGKGVPYATIPS
jgi:hypothetical protein